MGRFSLIKNIEGVKRLLNSKNIKNLGWKPKIKLKDGLKSYFKYYQNNVLPFEKNYKS